MKEFVMGSTSTEYIIFILKERREYIFYEVHKICLTSKKKTHFCKKKKKMTCFLKVCKSQDFKILATSLLTLRHQGQIRKTQVSKNYHESVL